jgi:predicted MFS family arabinose efflux permease
LEIFGASIILLVAFIFNEARSKHPLMPLSIFKVGNVAAANLTQLPIMAGMFSMFFFITLYIQNILGFSPVKAGLSFLPITIIIGLVSVSMSRVINKIGFKKPLIVAPVLMAAGLFYLAHIPVDGNYWADVFPGLAIMAAGMGMVFISITIAATNGVPARESGLASGLLTTAQQIGGSLGLAVLSGVSASTTASYLQNHAARASQPLVQAQAQVQGFHHALYIGTCFGLGAFVLAVLFIRHHKGEEISADSMPSAA